MNIVKLKSGATPIECARGIQRAKKQAMSEDGVVEVVLGNRTLARVMVREQLVYVNIAPALRHRVAMPWSHPIMVKNGT